MYDGILLVDKPEGWTSHDVVAKTRNLLKKESEQKIKVGHTGTLDPMATGLLVLLVGNYCKRAEEFTKLDKTYEVTLSLGANSTTGDREGELRIISDHIPTQDQVENVTRSFIGEISQTPPAYSAIKINGKRAYKLAREGKKVEIEPRIITVYDIKQIYYEYPSISFVVNVSSGTYIRSLAEDIGQKLETGAYLKRLRRTKIGKFEIKDSVLPTAVNLDKININVV